MGHYGRCGRKNSMRLLIFNLHIIPGGKHPENYQIWFEYKNIYSIFKPNKRNEWDDFKIRFNKHSEWWQCPSDWNLKCISNWNEPEKRNPSQSQLIWMEWTKILFEHRIPSTFISFSIKNLRCPRKKKSKMKRESQKKWLHKFNAYILHELNLGNSSTVPFDVLWLIFFPLLLSEWRIWLKGNTQIHFVNTQIRLEFVISSFHSFFL